MIIAGDSRWDLQPRWSSAIPLILAGIAGGWRRSARRAPPIRSSCWWVDPGSAGVRRGADEFDRGPSRVRRPALVLAVGLVGGCLGSVGCDSVLQTSMAFVLAILGPTDAVGGHRPQGGPAQALANIPEGESLVNDGTVP